MKNRTTLNVAAWFVLATCVHAQHGGSPRPDLTGELTSIGDVKVLRIWGTTFERGYAQGYLLAREILAIIKTWTDSPFAGDDDRFRGTLHFARNTLRLPNEYQVELNGMVRGILARLDRQPDKGWWRGYTDSNMLRVINSLPEIMAVGCSSFATWGEGSSTGATIAGRNLDWPVFDGLEGKQVIVVHMPNQAAGRLGWVSVTWPGFIGCLTGMNEEGVTVSMHDVSSISPTHSGRFYSRGFALRDAIEQARAATAFDDVRKTLSVRPSYVGNNVPVSRPYRGNLAGAVFEYDGRMDLASGVTSRFPREFDFIICTNHNRARGLLPDDKPQSCDRYGTLHTGLKDRLSASKKIGVEEAWEMLAAVAFPRKGRDNVVTHQSVVFEPNSHRFQLAVSRNGQSAPLCDRITVEVKHLLERPIPPTGQ